MMDKVETEFDLGLKEKNVADWKTKGKRVGDNCKSVRAWTCSFTQLDNGSCTSDRAEDREPDQGTL